MSSLRKLSGLQMVTCIFTLVVLGVFPLYVKDFYFDILPAKYKFYYISVLIMLLVVIILALYQVIKNRTYVSANAKSFREMISANTFKKKIDYVDIAFACFLITVIISTLQSQYLFEAFWGNEGRYNGLFLMLLYGISYFVLSRFFVLRRWYLDVFLAASMLVLSIGLAQYFGSDPIGFWENVDYDKRWMFASTIGNVNTYMAFAALVTGVSTALFLQEKNVVRAIWYYICVSICFASLITGRSDNVYLTLGAVFAFLPLWAFHYRRGVKRYFVLIATFFTVVVMVTHFINVYGSIVQWLDGLFRVIAGFRGLIWVAVLLWIFCAIWYAIDWKNKKNGNELANKWFRRGWLILLAVAATGLVVILIDVNVWGNSMRYGAFEEYLLFNDDWGTHRGYIWRIAWENYKEFPFMHKLFGYGPETFGILTVKNNYHEMSNLYGEIFDSAHNEYVQYFITIGPIGLLSYLGVFISACIKMIREKGRKPWLMAIVFAIICYGAQAFVNINIPIVGPILWTLMIIGVAGCRKQEEVDNYGKE